MGIFETKVMWIRLTNQMWL